MITVCLSGSMRFKSIIAMTLQHGRALGWNMLFPNLDFAVTRDGSTTAMISDLANDHFCAIDRADLLYVIDPGGYVGRMVGLEIGYTLGKGLPVFYLEQPSAPEYQALGNGVCDLERLPLAMENLAS